MEKIIPLFFLIFIVGIAAYFLPTVFQAFNLEAGGAEGNKSEALALSANGGEFHQAIIHGLGSTPDIFDVEQSLIDDSVFYAATNRGLLISKDGGENWHAFSDLEKKIDGAAIYKTVANRTNPKQIFISASKGDKGFVYLTEDNFFSLKPIFEIKGVAVADLEMDDGYLLLGLSDGRIMRYIIGSDLFMPLAAFNSAVLDLAVGNGAIYAATKSNGVFKSYDGGKIFTTAGNGIGPVKRLTLENERRIYAASLSGVLRSDDGGDWISVKTAA
ncbi:MAG: hypothetical protein HZA37_02210 [Parcubacteria group bacterium]|nr:hypothetical protein [Parcubacteria group bacterium]